MTAMAGAADWRIWHACTMPAGAGLVDLNTPERTVAAADPARPPAEARGAIVVGPVAADPATAAALVRPLAGGGQLVHPGLLWSLLDPLAPHPWPPGDDAGSPRDLARRAWERLAWWAEVAPAERAACGRLLDGAHRGAGRLVEALDRLAAAGSPFGAAARPAAPRVTVGMSPARPLPAAPRELGAWLTDPEGLGALVPGTFTPRQGQADLGEAVAAALAAEEPLLAEAGTGVGKTLAYLAALLARREAGERVVISTHTRALQAQILEHDLPRLAGLWPGLKARLLMGRRHYLCRRQRQAYMTRTAGDLLDAARIAALRLWLAATTEGLRDELVGHPLLAEDLGALFDSPQPCSPAHCFTGDGCYVTRARRRAREADVVVVNHALLLGDRQEQGAVVGPYDRLVVDEAHRLPEVALDTHAVRLDRQRLAHVLDLTGRPRPEGRPSEICALLADRLRELDEGEAAGDACEDFGRAAAAAVRAFETWWEALVELARPAARVAAGARVRVRDKDEAFAPVREPTAALLETAGTAAGAAARLAQRVEPVEDLPETVTDLLVPLAQAGQLLQRLARDVRFVCEDPDERWVAWLELDRRGSLRAAGATPLEAGPLLRETWESAGLAPVCTSATLAVGEDFSYMLGELGLGGRRPACRTLLAPSPFDHERQALALTLADLPAPEAPRFGERLAGVLLELRRRVRRQTLVLFTSYRLLDDVAARLEAAAAAARAAGDPDPVGRLVVQSARSGAAGLLSRFRGGDDSMLLGTSTFWEGVDFPGRALEILVVTKLPFLVPSDPWVEARCERLQQAGENPFTAFMVRDAALRLRQGVGRLLRRDTDRGVILLLDNRLHTKSYGTTFLTALPMVPHAASDVPDLVGRIARFWEAAGT